ncbi:hypothetical protein [Proteus mirabilis]|nr:hypothetical protein [Proteus mirabilis]NHU14200.1 hypothetical protein [Proteus mirabilis]
MNNNNDELNNALYRVALVLDKGLESTRELAAGYVETMGLGFDRSVRNLSYFFDGYEDVYENIKYKILYFHRHLHSHQKNTIDS